MESFGTAGTGTPRMSLRRPRTRLSDEVAEVLRERILGGEFAPGDRLRQEQLAAELDLSRTPIREALSLLQREGLVVPERSSGVRVVERDPTMLVAAYELREVVDGLAARLAARNLDEDIAAAVEEAFEEQQRVLDDEWSPEAWTRANTRFHGMVMHAAENPYLLSLLPFVQMTSQVFRPLSVLGRDRAEFAYDEHRAIADAVLAKDVRRAERLARAHIARTAKALRSELKGDGEHR